MSDQYSEKFVIVANADGSNRHAVSHYGDKDYGRNQPLCYGHHDPLRRGDDRSPAPRLGKNVVGPAGDYAGVATYEGDLCSTCRRVASSIAATERGFEVRDTLEAAYRSGLDEITITRDALVSILTSLAPWEAEGLDVRPDGLALTGEES